MITIEHMNLIQSVQSADETYRKKQMKDVFECQRCLHVDWKLCTLIEHIYSYREGKQQMQQFESMMMSDV